MINAVTISDTAYESTWYQMQPVDQVIIEMIIRRGQRPYEIKGLGVFVCSLETYLRVSQAFDRKKRNLECYNFFFYL